jgi:hypothetical protein
MDPLRHPDLVEVTRRLRSQYEQVAQAEEAAAAIMYQRRQTLRDRMIEAEDRGEQVRVTTTGGLTWEGVPRMVGLDYMMIGSTALALFHIEHAEFP